MSRQGPSVFSRTVSESVPHPAAWPFAIVLLIGCTPMTPDAVIREEERAYRQAEREAAFLRDKRQCAELDGIVVIERMGRARRRDVIRKVPGHKDVWYCQL